MAEHENLEFMAAVGEFAAASAALENALHRAIVAAFDDQRVERFLVDMRARALADHFAELYADAPGIGELAEEIRASLTERNRLMHGEIVMSFGKTWEWLLHNRKKGKHEPMPSGDTVKAAAERCRKASMLVEQLAETRDFDYSVEKLEEALHEGDASEREQNARAG